MSSLPAFLRKEKTHILQRLAGRGKTIVSYLHDFLSPFTPYLLCYSPEARMVTMKPQRSYLPRGRPTRLRQGYGVASKSDISSLLCKSQGPEPVFCVFLQAVSDIFAHLVLTDQSSAREGEAEQTVRPESSGGAGRFARRSLSSATLPPRKVFPKTEIDLLQSLAVFPALNYSNTLFKVQPLFLLPVAAFLLP